MSERGKVARGKRLSVPCPSSLIPVGGLPCPECPTRSPDLDVLSDHIQSHAPAIDKDFGRWPSRKRGPDWTKPGRKWIPLKELRRRLAKRG